jgi:hypothetical protein
MKVRGRHLRKQPGSRWEEPLRKLSRRRKEEHGRHMRGRNLGDRGSWISLVAK